MSNVQFEEGNYAGGRFDAVQVETPALVKLVLKTGLVKTETQANYVLIGIAACAFTAAFIVFYKTVTQRPPPLNQNVVFIKTTKPNSASQQ